DDERIAQVIWDLGGQAELTNPDHQSGTDRVWEVASKRPEFNWVLNVQGDEPFIEAAALQSLIQHLLQLDQAGSLAKIGTLITPITSYQEWCDPNVVKAVVSEQGNALYFSRSPVPYSRDTPNIPVNAYRHLGIYLFKRSVLERMTQWPVSPLEAIEKLEQLRALEKGVMISTYEIPKAPLGVDTPEDLERLVRSLS
ncbi:MAG: 3-deoxy-manno-octulosonate cytidylyltransferase, partial [Cyanobacteria bacterium]|nr:3-deoxy-manno-octulosonate cytidylyltransferase [Cyanobacteriota bacterium]